MRQTISKIEHKNGAKAIVYKTVTLENRYGIHTNNPEFLGGSSAHDYLTVEDLRQIHRELGKYLDTVDIERFKYTYCTIEDPSLTIFEYATDVFDDIHKAKSWLLRQPSNLTMEQIEIKLGQIKYGVFG